MFAYIFTISKFILKFSEMGTARIPKPVFTNETPDCDCSSEVSGASDLTFASDRESDDPPTADLISFSDDEEYDDQIFTSTL